MRVFRSFTVMTAILVCGLVVAGARAQAQQPPQGGAPGGRQGGAPPQNLQVLPKDTPRQQLTQIMRGYMSAIGAQNCNYCHTDDMAQRASDDNPKKGIARKMIQMTMDLNNASLTESGISSTFDSAKALVGNTTILMIFNHFLWVRDGLSQNSFLTTLNALETRSMSSLTLVVKRGITASVVKCSALAIIFGSTSIVGLIVIYTNQSQLDLLFAVLPIKNGAS